jgi:hypothetical protein
MHEANTLCKATARNTQQCWAFPPFAAAVGVEVCPVIANVNVANLATLAWFERIPACGGDTSVLVGGGPRRVFACIGDRYLNSHARSIAEAELRQSRGWTDRCCQRNDPHRFSYVHHNLLNKRTSVTQDCMAGYGFTDRDSVAGAESDR